MSQEADNERRIIDTWQRHAKPWTRAVRDQQIESRRLATDAAMVDAVLACTPHTVLDVGCGEGWLARALASHGLQVTGVDLVPALIKEAQREGGGQFVVATYRRLIAGVLDARFDAVACNFSLIGRTSVEELVINAPALLSPGGCLIVQTLHPLIACADAPYRDGWRAGSWAGFSDDFIDPAPWYFRTVESWVRLFDSAGLQLRNMREPLDPRTGKPASIIFIAMAANTPLKGQDHAQN